MVFAEVFTLESDFSIISIYIKCLLIRTYIALDSNNIGWPKRLECTIDIANNIFI